MPKTAAQKLATMKYDAKAYDRIELKVKKGNKPAIQTHASGRGESLNGFIKRAIFETIQRDTNAPSL